MALHSISLVLLCVFASINRSVTSVGNKNAAYRVCYYVNDGNLTPNLINSTLCTHIIFGFGQVTNNSLAPAKSTDVPVYRQLMKLKTSSPDLKILLSVGGGGGSGGLPGAASTEAYRKLFVNQALKFLDTYGFDGLDIDWEFPGWNGDPPENINNFVELLKAFRTVINKSNKHGKKPLITAAVASPWTIIEVSYNVPEMAKYVDFVNVMCYDYHMYQPSFPFTGYNSPLFNQKDDVIFIRTLNINWTANFWEAKGMPKSKIVLGIATYGHTYKLLLADRHSLRAPTVGPGSGGGWINYPEVCAALKTGATRVFDEESMVPYIYQDTNWASYDDQESFHAKAKWIFTGGYAGVMTWNLNSDDWKGICGGEPFPLHKILQSIVH